MTDEYPEEPKNTETETADDEEPSILVIVTENDVLTNLIERCGKWSKLVHVIMNCFLFCARCRKKSITLEHDQLYS